MYPKQNKQVAANIITAIIRITLLCNHKSVKTNKIDTNNCKMKTLEKPRDFDPFGHAGFAHLWLQYD